MSKAIGFIGLGVMGFPMAGHLSEAYKVYVFNRSKQKSNNWIKKYNGKTVTVMGFMFPLEQSEKQKKFLIGPYPLSCPFHYHVGPSQVIEISSDKAIDFSFDPITIKGRLEVKYNKETGTFYYLKIFKS